MWFWHLINRITRILQCLLLVTSTNVFGNSPDITDIAEGEPTLISLTINGQLSDPSALVIRASNNQWWLPIDALRRAKVIVSGDAVRTFNEASYVPLSSLKVSALNFDEATQSLSLRLMPSQFEPTRLQLRTMQSNSVAPGAGAFLNYDLLLEHSTAGRGVSAFAQLGGAIGPGVFIADQWFIDRPEFRRALRLDTSYTVDDVAQMRTLRIGDSITRATTLLGRPVRIGGLQWGNNFLIRPDLITVPTATLSGQSALPSTADLYVNNVLQSRQSLPPGPFSISTAPIVTGDGEVLLKLTDPSGQEQLISQRFYATTALLAAGLSDYSLEIGALRKNVGIISNDYGDLLASASWRHGFTDSLTAEGNASIQQGGPSGLLVGLTNAIPGLGVVTVAAGASHGEAGNGAQLAIGIERRTNPHSFSLRSQAASSDYRQSGVDADQTLRRLDNLFYGYQIAGLGSLGLSWTRQQRMNNASVSIATASFSTRQSRWGSLILSLADLSAESRDTSLNIFWVLSLGPSTSASAFHTQSEKGASQDVFQIQKSMPSAEGWGYRLQLARNAAQQAALTAQNAYGVARIEAAELRGDTSTRGGLSGAIATLDGRWFLSRRIDSSFGVARLPGFAKVRVYVDNQLAARTNDKGYALLPRLYPYLKNNVSVEQLDLPMDAQIDSLKVQPVPSWRSGVVVNLPVRRIFAATLNLIGEDGTPVPAGASVTLSDADNNEGPFGVGHDGLVYLSGLKQDNAVLAEWPGGQCRARIPYQPEPGRVPYLGEYICRRLAEAP